MRLGILTTIWGRPALTRVFLDYYAGLEVPGVDLRPMAVYSSTDSTFDTHNLGYERWTWMRVDFNKPLAQKWNAGAAVFENMDIDALMILGSDDFVTPAYIERVKGLLEEGYDYIVPTSCYFYDQPTGRLAFADMDKVGAGRVMSRPLLEATDWEPWLDTPRNPDYALSQKAGRMAERPATVCVRGAPLVDVKTGTNIFSFDKQMAYAKRRQMIPSAEGWFAEHYSGLYDQLQGVPA